MFSGNRFSLSGGSAEVRSLQERLRAPAQNGGSVTEALRQASAEVRRQAIVDRRGSDLMFEVALDVVSRDNGQDAVFLNQMLRDVGAQPLQPGESPPVTMRVPNKLGNAAYVLSAQNLRPEFEHGRLPNIALQQLMAGELPFDSYARSFHVSRQLLPELMDRGIVSVEQYSRMPGADPALLSRFAELHLARGILEPDRYVALGFRLTNERLNAMLKEGTLSPQTYLAMPGADKNRVEDFLLDGMISFKEALPHMGFLRLSDAEMYITATAESANPGTWQDWLQGGQAISSDLREGVERGLFGVDDIPFAGENSFALVEHLHQAGILDSDSAAGYAIPLWEPKMQMPNFLKDVINGFATHESLCANLPLPGGPGDPKNAPFLTRAVAVWSLGHGTTVAHQVPTGPFSECMVCLSEPEEGIELFTLCNHAARMDLDCFMSGIESNGGWRCPDSSCGRPFGPDEVFTIKNDPAAAQACALSRMGDYRAQHVPDWQNCSTEGCPEGLEVAEGQVARFNCRCCGNEEVLAGPLDPARLLSEEHIRCGCHPYQDTVVQAQQIFDHIETLTEAKMQEIERLCEMWTNPPRNPDRNGGGDRPNVPCFFDSANLMHGDACQHMTHSGPGGCNHEIHQSDGPYKRSQHDGLYNYGPIRYVPYGPNILVQYGCFQPYQPGFTEPPGEAGRDRRYVVANTVSQNVRNLRQRFNAYQAEVNSGRRTENHTSVGNQGAHLRPGSIFGSSSSGRSRSSGSFGSFLRR